LNVQEYIESGMLELYASGKLSAAEAAEVELMLQKHPELKAELQEIELSLEQYAQAFAKKPPSHLKESILVQLNGDVKQHPASAAKIKQGRQVSIQRFNYMAAASMALILLSTSFAFYYYGKWQNSEGQLTALQSENRLFAEQNNTYKTSLEQKSADLAIMRNSGNMMVKMKGGSNSSMLATVYFDKGKNKVFLDVNSLPALPSDKQYQLWAIVDAKPVDMGVFDVMPEGETKLLHMKEVEDPQAFAVTIEPRGGSPAPTSAPMMLGAAI
jgi:anti-sigma-K factor RskA